MQRIRTVYLRTLEKLPNTLLSLFLDGKHVVHLMNGFWNRIWSGMSIESAYMKIRKGQNDYLVKTTQEKAVKIWTLSHHLCAELMAELKGLRE